MTIDSTSYSFDLHRHIAELGADMGPAVRDETAVLFASQHQEVSQHEILRDLSYGADPRNRLDIHLPLTKEATLRPILCFVHGGGFIGGDKSKPGQPYYDNVGSWAVSSGCIGVNITYRFAPEFTYPAGAEDVASALSWIGSNASNYGGDPARIIVMGHSAGAAHVATCIATPELRARAGSNLVGAILSSGIYDPSLGPNTYSSYYGSDVDALSLRASIEGLCELDLPVLVSSAQFDPPDIQEQTVRLITAYAHDRGRLPQFVQSDGHNHYSVMYQLGTKETWFTDRLWRFIEENVQ